MEYKIAIGIVNFNCLQHTKQLILDLNRQTYCSYHVYLYDQGSIEDGTQEYLDELSLRDNFTIIQNGKNVPLNHVWNKFVADTPDVEYICFLNNDIRIPSNYLNDTVFVLRTDMEVGIVCHATNHQSFRRTIEIPTYKKYQKRIQQGWDFTMRKSDWVEIPKELQFYCGDDFIFDTHFLNGRHIGIVTSSPIKHLLSQTRETMLPEDRNTLRNTAISDIEKYKKLGNGHVFNNIPTESQLNPINSQITELPFNANKINATHFHNRLKQHIEDVEGVDGIILDVGTNDAGTFDALCKINNNNKQVIGIDYQSNTLDSNIGLVGQRPEKLLNRKVPNSVLSNGFSFDMHDLDESVSFAICTVLDPTALSALLPVLWDKMSVGGTIFFPYYHLNTAPNIAPIIDDFFKDKLTDVYFSRVQTKPGIRDTYVAIKCHKQKITYPKRDKPLIIVAVLKMGGIYDESYVNKLASAVKRHTTVDYKFVCLMDGDESIIDKNVVDEIVPLKYNLSGWWSKLELFRADVFNDTQVLYLDLDTLIVQNIDDFANYGGGFYALRDFNTLVNMGSGIMGWNANDMHYVFDAFVSKLANGSMNIKQISGGDQEAIEMLIDGEIKYVQDLFPNKMGAFKYHCYNEAEKKVILPDLVSVVCFHSQPKMADLLHDKHIQEHWR